MPGKHRYGRCLAANEPTSEQENRVPRRSVLTMRPDTVKEGQQHGSKTRYLEPFIPDLSISRIDGAEGTTYQIDHAPARSSPIRRSSRGIRTVPRRPVITQIP